LFVAVENFAKPVFAEQNFEAYDTYERAKTILRSIVSNDMSEYLKVLAIHDYLIYSSVYDFTTALSSNLRNRSNWANGPLLFNIGVSDGFAKAFSLLCGIEGIECHRIIGYKNGDLGYAWNKVGLDLNNDGIKEYYIIDIEADSPRYDVNNYEYVTHSYFLLSDLNYSTIEANRDIWPTTNTVDCYDLYDIDENGNDLYIQSMDELRVYLSYLVLNKNIMNGRDVKIIIEDVLLPRLAIEEVAVELGIILAKTPFQLYNNCYFIFVE